MTPRLAEILAAMVAAALDAEAAGEPTARSRMRSPGPRTERQGGPKRGREERRDGPGARG